MLVVGVANLSFGVLLGWILAGKERAESGEDAAMKAATAARVQALQSQMNPHVLFNAISGLTELVREDPAAAEKALVNLSGLLRSLLEHGSRLLAPLSLERALVEQYVSLEQMRLGKRLRVEWQWDPSLEHREIPPLMVQPLVENAIKHGIAPQRGGGDLRICLRDGGGALELEVANTGAPLQEDAPGGLGMRNLRERLALLGESEGAFKLWREGEWTRALVRLESREKLP
jgi:LytS/YehU family sensor histidine kinase